MSETRVQRRARERREEALREHREEEYRARRKEEYRERREDGYGSYGSKRERDRKQAQERQRKRRRARAGGVIALIIILVVAFTALRVWMEVRPGGAEPIVTAGAEDFSGKGRINLLFLGTNHGLSDTMMVFSFDMENKRLDEISIPRDTYYYRSSYPGAAYQKINSVYSTEGYKGVSKAASDVLGGIPIHYYAELKPDGVKKIVDAMGGVVMDVPMDMDYEDPDQGLYIHLKAGRQLLNGDQAMQYLRFRSGYANADIGRVGAQQGFLKAVLSQSAGLDIPKIALAASNESKSNLSLPSAMGLMARAGGMQGWAFNTYTIPGTAGMQDGASYYFHDAAGTKELMRQIYANER